MQKRKQLTKGDFRTKHSNWGHLLLGIGVLIAIEGPVNTYLRAGKALFLPSPSCHPGVRSACMRRFRAMLCPERCNYAGEGPSCGNAACCIMEKESSKLLC